MAYLDWFVIIQSLFSSDWSQLYILTDIKNATLFIGYHLLKKLI